MRWQIEEIAKYAERLLEQADPDSQESYLDCGSGERIERFMMAIGYLLAITDAGEGGVSREKIWEAAAQIALHAMVYARAECIKRFPVSNREQDYVE